MYQNDLRVPPFQGILDPFVFWIVEEGDHGIKELLPLEIFIFSTPIVQ